MLLFNFIIDFRLLGGIFAAWWSSGAVHRDTRGTYVPLWLDWLID